MARIGSIIVVVNSLIIGNYALECHKRRCLQSRLEHSRQAWNNGPAICCRTTAGPVHCPAHETRPPHPSENRCPSPYRRNRLNLHVIPTFPVSAYSHPASFVGSLSVRLQIFTLTLITQSLGRRLPVAVTEVREAGQSQAETHPGGYSCRPPRASPPLWIRRASASRGAEKRFPSARYFLGSGPSTASPTVPDRPLDPDVVTNAKDVNKDPPVGQYAMPFGDSNAVKPRMQPVQRKPSSSPRTEIPYQPLARCGGSLRTRTPSHP